MMFLCIIKEYSYLTLVIEKHVYLIFLCSMLPRKLLWCYIECSLQYFCNMWLGGPYRFSCVAEKPCREAHQVGYARCTRTTLEVQMSDLIYPLLPIQKLKTPLCPSLIKSSCCSSVLVLHIILSLYIKGRTATLHSIGIQ